MPAQTRGLAGLCMALPLAAALLLAGCVPPADQGDSEETAAPDSLARESTETYERHLVFLAADIDTTFIVPISFRTVAGTTIVQREIRGWLNRGGNWDPFFSDGWASQAGRTPWRIVPRPPLRLVVGPQDAITSILFEEGPRRLELRPGQVMADFSGPRGESFRIQEGSLLLSDRRIEGILLNASRAWQDPSAPMGDLALLTSGDSVQIVLQGRRPGGSIEAGTPWRAWTRIDFREQLWENLSVRWSGARAFEPARRDIPDGWSFESPDGSFRGQLGIRTLQLDVGVGEGPLLPVEAVFEVEGTLSVDGLEIPVHGLIRHFQPS
jgi:hypothetical protein